jgi:succinate dehydrogenase/fumarate reductase cytochrome b subunit
MNGNLETERPSKIERRLQNYRGTWAWLIQRISAICLFLLIPLKIYTGWAARDMVPYPESWVSGKKIHLNSGIDIALLLFFLLHGFYGLRVILMDFGIIKANSFFWRTMILAIGIFAALVWCVYFRASPE